MPTIPCSSSLHVPAQAYILKGQVPDEPSERIEEGGREYINTLTQRQKEQLLGVYGSREVEAGVSWTQKARAYNGTKLEGRIIIPESLRNHMIDGKINIEEFAKRLTDETNEQFEEKNMGLY